MPAGRRQSQRLQTRRAATAQGASNTQVNTQATTQVAGGLRRSIRVPKPSQRAILAGKTISKAVQPGHHKVVVSALNKFILQVYAEIHDATVNPIPPTKLTEVQDLIRQARTLRFFDLLPAQASRQIRAALDAAQPTNRGQKKIVARAVDDLKVSYPSRLLGFCKASNLLLLSVCAHSESFRTAIARGNTNDGSAKWGDVLIKIKQCASSLELFAKTRNLDWDGALRASDNDFGILLASTFATFAACNNVDKTIFGIGPHDLKHLHDPEDHIPHHWVLPLKRESARRCRIDYKFSGYLDTDDFWGAAVPGGHHNNATTKPSAGDPQTADQMDVAESILLPNHSFSYLPAKAQGDPRFAGYTGYPCTVCGREQASGRTRAASRRPCTCTFADLCQNTGCNPEALVELIDTETMGTGVRALQAFQKDDYIGEYIGQVYKRYVDSQGSVDCRYHGDEGTSYLFPSKILRQSDYPDRTARMQTRRGGKTAPAAPAAPAPAKDTTEYFNLDPAIYGNWTRYINHSCQPNTGYKYVNMGQLSCVVIHALEDIECGQVLTVDYGGDYFKHFSFGCKCGYASCKYWKQAKGGGNMTLKTAKLKGVAPAWAMNDPNIPIEVK